jgi:hypothetical protein
LEPAWPKKWKKWDEIGKIAFQRGMGMLFDAENKQYDP